MLEAIVRQWHRLILGRTVKEIPRDPGGRIAEGTLDSLAMRIEQGAWQALPAGVTWTIARRTALDVPRGAVRIVIEVPE